MPKEQSKKDSEKILKKAMGKFFSISSIQDMLDLKILDAKFEKDKIKDNKIPIIINYRLTLNYNTYIQKVKELEQTFKNLGIKLHKRVDLPYIEYNKLRITNRTKVHKLTASDFGIIKKYGQNYKLDVWSFPKDWKGIHLFNLKEKISFTYLFQIILELKDAKGNIILADRLRLKPITNYYLLTSYIDSHHKYYSSFGKRTVKILNPLLDSSVVYVDSLSTKMVDLENIDKIKDISIELEEK
jgi:hypothetical protein